MKLVATSMFVRQDHWRKFAAASAARGLSAAANLRQLIAEFLRSEARRAS
jgi:hypothetical protein